MTEFKNHAEIWGFEGCGAMWSFFSKQESALRHAGENEVYSFRIHEAFDLDNRRRLELGYSRISLEQFYECIDLGESCSLAEDECIE
ncbi:MAG: hypothetical protein ACFFEF_06835 [Candidatus Thorarchaeota archaeon]